jgi:hypothetical protein
MAGPCADPAIRQLTATPIGDESAALYARARGRDQESAWADPWRGDPKRAQKGEAVEIGVGDLAHLDAEPVIQPLRGEMAVAIALSAALSKHSSTGVLPNASRRSRIAAGSSCARISA